jgi:hypothetical protein
MPTTPYDRYGLTSNPFRELASENLEDIELYHVNLDVDRSLETIKEETFDKENRALVALVGLHGAGKTERLLVAQAEARERKAFCVFFDITTKNAWATKGIAQAINKSSRLGGFQRVFSSPKWLRDVLPLEKIKDTNYDPVKAGQAIAGALNANAPSLLLLNDLHNLSSSSELNVFSKMLQELVDSIKPGVLVMFGAFPSFMLQLATDQAPLASRINRTLLLPRISADEASLLIAKKLLAKRLVEGLDPLYPFDRESVQRLNQISVGNPRRLLEMCDVALEYAVTHRAYRIDVEAVRSAILERQVGELKSMVDNRTDPWEEDSFKASDPGVDLSSEVPMDSAGSAESAPPPTFGR